MKSENGNDRMSLKEATFLLMKMAERNGIGEDDVRALQVAVRRLQKRVFENARRWGRRNDARRLEKLAGADGKGPICQGSAKTGENCQALANGKPEICQGPANPAPDCQPLAKTALDVCRALANPPFGCQPLANGGGVRVLPVGGAK